MFSLSKDYIKKIYSTEKSIAYKNIKKESWASALTHIDNAAIVAYNLNLVFKDDEIEEWLAKSSSQLIVKKKDEYKQNANRYLFYDQIGNSSVLAVQYIRALKNWGVEFMYVLDPSRHTNRTILSEIENYSKATILILPKSIDERVNNIQYYYDTIREYGAEKAFIHSPAEGAFGVVLLNALPEITRYRIVPGDHHFYIGTTVSDYCIEFREFGYNIALQKRGFSPRQILIQPYYPIINRNASFAGFPKETEGKVVFFSGGALYKIYGHENIYFKLVKQILDAIPNAVILYAGGGNMTPLNKFIRKNRFENRVILLGYRKDIYEVFNHCDIYLGTIPIIGGLMSQYAAVCSKPIVQFEPKLLYATSRKGVDSILSYNNNHDIIAWNTIDEAVQYAVKLARDVDFRKQEGIKLYSRVIDVETFNRELKRLIETNTPAKCDWQIPVEFFEEFENFYIENLDKYSALLDIFMLRTMKSRLWRYPRILFRSLFNNSVRNYIFKKILK